MKNGKRVCLRKKATSTFAGLLFRCVFWQQKEKETTRIRPSCFCTAYLVNRNKRKCQRSNVDDKLVERFFLNKKLLCACSAETSSELYSMRRLIVWHIC